MKLYPISTESIKPDDLQSGIATEIISIYTSPERTNMSGQELVSGWLGSTNDITSYAMGEFDDEPSIYNHLRSEGYIPLSEASANYPECDVEDDRLAQVEHPIWVPAILRYEEIANIPGHDGLDSWLWDERSRILNDIRAKLNIGLSLNDALKCIEQTLESEANNGGYTLVGLDRWLKDLWGEAES